MGELIKGLDEVVTEVRRHPRTVEEAKWSSIYDIELWRDGRKILEQREHNILTLEGKRYIIDIAMKGATNVYTIHQNWYVLLSSTNTTPNPTTMLYTAKQFVEFVNFKAPTTARQTWTGTLDPSAASMTNNSAKASFTIGANPLTPVYGAGLVTLNTLGDNTAGDYLLSFSLFTSSITVAEDDVVKVGITVQLA